MLAWRWVAPAALQAEMAAAHAEHFTPWFKLEWERSLARPPPSAVGPSRSYALGIPLIQAYRVGRYIAGRKLRGVNAIRWC